MSRRTAARKPDAPQRGIGEQLATDQARITQNAVYDLKSQQPRRRSARSAFAQSVGRQVAGMQESALAQKVADRIDAGIAVGFRKPRFMPGWLYLRLLRSIVVTRRG